MIESGVCPAYNIEQSDIHVHNTLQNTFYEINFVILEYKAAFELFDKDSSGTISAEELGDVCRGLGHNPTDGQVQNIINDADTDSKIVCIFE